MAQQQPPPYGKSGYGVPLVQQEYPPAQERPGVAQGYAPQQQQYPVQGAYAPQQQQGYGYSQPPVTSVQQVTIQQAPQATVIVAGSTYHPDYMGFSIFNMLCCCFCLGIAAIIQSCAAKDANNAGNSEVAKSAGQQALLFNRIGLGIGLAMHVTWIVAVIVVVATGLAVFGSAASAAGSAFSDWSNIPFSVNQDTTTNTPYWWRRDTTTHYTTHWWPAAVPSNHDAVTTPWF